MNISMWHKALTVIPSVSKAEWDQLDVISKWLISTRAAVLVMTFISAALAGLFAWRDDTFSLLPWLALAFGLVMAHASNNLFNDFTDYVLGVDQKKLLSCYVWSSTACRWFDDKTTESHTLCDHCRIGTLEWFVSGLVQQL